MTREELWMLRYNEVKEAESYDYGGTPSETIGSLRKRWEVVLREESLSRY